MYEIEYFISLFFNINKDFNEIRYISNNYILKTIIYLKNIKNKN